MSIDLSDNSIHVVHIVVKKGITDCAERAHLAHGSGNDADNAKSSQLKAKVPCQEVKVFAG